MNILDRFIKYVTVDTTSVDGSGTHPSAKKEFDLANILVDELHSIGVKDAFVDDSCYVYGHIAATKGYEKKVKIGFIAHVDTAPDFSGTAVNPIVIKNYDGKDLKLGNTDRILSSVDFPELPELAGRTLITTDGTTLLGADDKAGVVAIMAMAEEIIKNDIPHGQISICFTPDEEIGEGALLFDIEKFDADFAYTIDGGKEGEVVYENFNAARLNVIVDGFNIHPGDAKDRMINAQQVAIDFNNMLPYNERPEYTSGYEGFFLLTSMSGNVEKAELSYIIRDFELDTYNKRLELVKNIAEFINKKYGKEIVKYSIRNQYWNMKEKILPHMDIVLDAEKASEMAGVTPIHKPIRGGTDGAMLSYKGLPCPNLGTAGYAFHGPYEHITVEGMEKVAEILINIIKINAKK